MARFSPKTLKLEPGDRLILYSDGMAETLSQKGEDGYRALARFFASRPRLPATEACFDFLHHHPFILSGQRQPDDFSVLVLARRARDLGGSQSS